MLGRKSLIVWKYFRIELFLLLFVCFISPVLSDIEYSNYEEKNVWNFTASLEYRLVYGTFSFILSAVYYWFILKPLVFRKKFLHLILSVLGYIVVYHLFNKYENWLISKLSFLTPALRKRAWDDYQNTAIYFIISYALSRLVFTFIGFAFLIRSLQQDEEVKFLKEQQLLAELNYLRAQLQPHFFFNTLNNIYALAMGESKKTAPTVAKLSEMMRYILYETSQPKVSLQKEVAFLRNYVDLEKIRYPPNIKIDFEVQGIEENSQIEPLILLPLIENSFKHGIGNELEDGFTNIVICVSGNELTLQVENSKPPATDKKKTGGVGLQNMRKRLDLLYAGRHRWQIEDAAHIYHVNLTLQMI